MIDPRLLPYGLVAEFLSVHLEEIPVYLILFDVPSHTIPVFEALVGHGGPPLLILLVG